ncbi:FMN-binding protein Acg [Mycobacterium cookii]|uniref:Putative NAD(P)H nitroreductase acg n=1 Tax=Mycobacterium cookii TaxID=1775 RepID=A0A7I7KWI8_9MYCO|nr:NAD(P)H nitroreductase [Mycobacterium cookii]MCV7329939.1 NAD(P)H nitroreductase [Mycobacterium cookii]BBX45868.1 putative NAD(P)H nitroreductase acg [Mycobacterium cookii]
MPTTLFDSKVIQDAVTAACRAPSLHNSQPWQWVYSDGQLRLFLDPSRVMDTDQSAREALMGCGAAIDHLRVAMAAAGWKTHVEYFPNPDSSNHLASMSFGPIDYVTERDRLRAQAIWTRRTDRLPFSAPTEWQSISSIWAGGMHGNSVRIDTIPTDLLPKLTDAAQIAESIRLYDSAYHDELHWWTAPFEKTEGIPHSALVSAAESDRVGIERVFPVVHRPERRSEIPEDQAMILLLSTDGDSREDALASGEALSAILLECTMVGFATCTVTHLTELDETRKLLQSLTRPEASPQILVRMGVVPVTEKAPQPTPRRPLSEVLRLRAFD